MTRYTSDDDISGWTCEDSPWYSYLVDPEDLKAYLDTFFYRSDYDCNPSQIYWDDSTSHDLHTTCTWITSLPVDTGWEHPRYPSHVADVLEDLRIKTKLSFASLCLKILDVGRKRKKAHN